MKGKKNIEDIVGLTPMQEGMLFHYLRAPESDLYFEQLCLRTTGHIDTGFFENAWNIVIDTNQVLRTRFHWEKLGNPLQIILKEHKVDLITIDLCKERSGEIADRLHEIKAEDRARKFDLHNVPFRVTLVRISEDRYEMIISHHHILFDGWSNGIILHEFFSAYGALAGGQEYVKPVKSEFKEYIKWIRGRDRGGQETFWREYLTGFDSAVELPVKKTVRRVGGGEEGHGHGTFAQDSLTFKLEKDLQTGFEAIVREHKVTIASLLYTAFGILLQRYHDNHDVIFGTTVSGRSAEIKDIENMVGLFINTLPLRVKSHPGRDTLSLIKEINEALHIRKEYEASPLVDIKRYGSLDNRKELFNTIVVIENYPLEWARTRSRRGLLTVSSYSMFEMTHYDLTVIIPLTEDIRINFLYNQDVLASAAIERMSRHMLAIFDEIVNRPEKEIGALDMLSGEEKHELLFDFNDTAAEYPANKTIHGLFAEQAERTPDNIAVVSASGNEPAGIETIRTYRQLHEEANDLARRLREIGVGSNTIAALSVERSIEIVVGILAILKAGGAYLPIDPTYPRERIDYILADSRAKLLLTNNELASGGPLLITNPDTAFPSSGIMGAAPAYIIYTSGSTGKPKGVVVEHRSVINLLYALHNEYPVGEADTYLLKTSYTFDVSVTELFGWYMGGGRCALLEKGGEKDPKKIIDTIASCEATHINFVPAMFNAFVEELKSETIHKLASVKYIFLAGEALPAEPVRRFRDFGTGIALENIYGPTEATVYAANYSLSRWQDGAAIPIGKPMRNMAIYIINKNNRLQPAGVPGELCIAGHGLARGYLNNPELTSDKFPTARGAVEGPSDYLERAECKTLSGQSQTFDEGQEPRPVGDAYMRPNPDVGARRAVPEGQERRGSASFCVPPFLLYRTGDLARWNFEGNIEFLGRLDSQVKIRGFRVEPGEIENQLLSYEGVMEAVVMARPYREEGEDVYLCAYIVPGPAGIDVSKLKHYLSGKLPDYMIPAFFVSLTCIPLTRNGKVDRRALPRPEVLAAGDYVAPRDDVEKSITGIWLEVLGIERPAAPAGSADQDIPAEPGNLRSEIRISPRRTREEIGIGIDTNFFEIGGHSLKAVVMLARIDKIFHMEISLTDFFRTPTIRALAGYVKGSRVERHRAIVPMEKKEYYTLSSAQKRLYIIQQMEPESTNYNIYIALKLAGQIDKAAVDQAPRELIRRHESLRTCFERIAGKAVQRILDHRDIDFKIEPHMRGEAFSCGAKTFDEGHGSEIPSLGGVAGGRGGLGDQQRRGEPCVPPSLSPVDEFIDRFVRPFDLSQAPLLRICLIKAAAGEYIFLMDVHHIIFDGISMGIFFEELFSLYEGNTLPELRLQYKDYSGWRDRSAADERERARMKSREEYWLGEFSGDLPLLDMETDYVRPQVRSSEGDTVHFEIGPEETLQLKRLGREEQATLFMTLIALFYVLLYKLSGREDIVIGTLTAGRKHADVAGMIGMFVVTLPLRNFPAAHKTFREFLREVKERTLKAFENQEYPYEELVEKVVKNRDMSRNPLYDVGMIWQNLDWLQGKSGRFEKRDFTISPMEYNNMTSKLDIFLEGSEINKKIAIAVQYCTRLFMRETIERFIVYFLEIVSNVITAPERRLDEIVQISTVKEKVFIDEFSEDLEDE